MRLAEKFGLQAEQIGMKCGILVGTLFPLAAIVVYAVLLKNRKKHVQDEL